MTNFFATGLPLTKEAELLQSKFHLLSETSMSFETLSVLFPQISHMALCILRKGQIAALESWNEPPSISENKQLPEVETTQCKFRRHLASLRGSQGGLQFSLILASSECTPEGTEK